jgi:hypothetical protein
LIFKTKPSQCVKKLARPDLRKFYPLQGTIPYFLWYEIASPLAPLGARNDEMDIWLGALNDEMDIWLGARNDGSINGQWSIVMVIVIVIREVWGCRPGLG